MVFNRIEVKNHGRGIVAKEAYRSGQRAYDNYHGRHFDYSARQDLVVHRFVVPEVAEGRYGSAIEFWDAVEAYERRKDARLAKEVLVSLPRQLDEVEQSKLVEGFVEQEFTRKNLIVSYAIHAPQAADGGTNPHAHILVYMRPATETGFSRAKLRDFDGRAGIHQIRHAWARELERSIPKAQRPNLMHSAQQLKPARVKRVGLKHFKSPQKITKVAKQFSSLERLYANRTLHLPAPARLIAGKLRLHKRLQRATQSHRRDRKQDNALTLSR